MQQTTPTSLQDFQICHQLHALNWKKQISFIQQLTNKIGKLEDPLQIEICFLEMLQQKNVNVLAKILKLIQDYINIYGISIISLRELTCHLLILNQFQAIVAEVLEKLVNTSIKCEDDVEDILKGIVDGIVLGSITECAVKIMNCLMKNNLISQFVTNSTFQNVLKLIFGTPATSGLSEIRVETLKNIVGLLGTSSLLLARKLDFSESYVTQIKKMICSQQNGKHDVGIDIQINYTYDLCSQNWLEDYKTASLKCVCLSLKQALGQANSCSVTLTPKFLQSLLWLSQKKTKNNKHIYDIISNSLTRTQLTHHPTILLEILLYCISDKRITKKLLQQSITSKEQMWLYIATQESIKQKINKSTCQQQYHRLIILLNVLKVRELMDVQQLCEELLKKDNLSSVYRIQLEHIVKM